MKKALALIPRVPLEIRGFLSDADSLGIHLSPHVDGELTIT